MRTLLRNFTPTLLLLSIIAILSLANMSKVSSIPPIPHIDKLAHFLMYFALSGIILFDCTRSYHEGKINSRCILYSILIASLLGGIMEILQMTITPNRQAEVLDMVANTLGAITGAFVGKLLIPFALSILPSWVVRKKKDKLN